MLKALLNKLKPNSGSKVDQPVASVTPDISRVIKMMPPPPAMPPAADAEWNAPIGGHDPDELGDRAEAAVEDLSSRFDAWMQADLDRLRTAWNTAKAAGASHADYKLLETCAHNIRGVATSYGYPAVSRLCGSLSTLLSKTGPGENAALINLHVEACMAAYGSIGRGDAAQSVANAVCDALEERVAVKTSRT
jgi:HPt (histidine-containing phosphotransfer) domain-containing protein